MSTADWIARHSIVSSSNLHVGNGVLYALAFVAG
jgi:hypothetical protein